MIKRILPGVVAILVLGVGALYFAYLRPVPKFQPTGAYNIGTTSFDFLFTTKSGALRKLAIRAWYPSDATEGEISPVSSERMVAAAMQSFGMPESLATVEDSLSFLDAPIAAGTELFPVVIFNHGFGSFAEQNTVNMQELASNGYIVLSLSHPGTSVLTEYTDGSFVYADQSLPAFVEAVDVKGITKATKVSIERAADEVQNAEDFPQYWQAMRSLAQSTPFAAMQPVLDAWIEDSNAVIDALAKGKTLQFPAIFVARMDMENIGIAGHSLGGIVALAVANMNGAVKAVLNLDGPFAYDAPLEKAVLQVPTCMLMAEELALGSQVADMSRLNAPLLKYGDQSGCYAVFKGARHMNFTDLNYVAFLKLMPILGSVDQADFGVELNNLMVNFFNRYLKDADVAYAPLNGDLVAYREFIGVDYAR